MKKLIRNGCEARKKATNSDMIVDWQVQIEYIDPVSLTENCFLAFALADNDGELPICVERENYRINT